MIPCFVSGSGCKYSEKYCLTEVDVSDVYNDLIKYLGSKYYLT